MADVIALHPKDSSVFRELLDDTLNELDTAAHGLLENAMNLGFHGPWREWNEQQPVGAVMMLEPAALAECGDPRLAKLYALYCGMTELVEEFRAKEKA
jgi:hypothetical protein